MRRADAGRPIKPENGLRLVVVPADELSLEIPQETRGKVCQSLRSSSLRFKRVMRSIRACEMARISAGRPGRDKQKM
jgi:hypothetical protein